jgi:hypothetical protein
VADTSNVVDAPTKVSQSQFGFPPQKKSPDKMKHDVAINGQDDFSFCSTSSSAQKNVRASVVTKGSNIRKSIQSLGKLINTSEKRYSLITSSLSNSFHTCSLAKKVQKKKLKCT